MFRTLIAMLAFLMPWLSIGQTIGINTTSPSNSAILDVFSTNKGFLPPRLTTSQRDAIDSPSLGLIIYNLTNNCIEVFRGTGWFNLCSQNFELNSFNKLYGGNEFDIGTYVVATKDGGFITCSSTKSSNTGTLIGVNNNGGYDIWIQKFYSNGKLEWQKLWGGLGDDYGLSIQQISDGGYIMSGSSYSSNTGSLTGLINNGDVDALIIKFDNAGNIIWQKLLGGSSRDICYSVKQTNDGSFIASGRSSTGASPGLTGFLKDDAWVFKLDSTGNLIWQKLFGGTEDEYLNNVLESQYGGFVLSGFSYTSNTGTLTDNTNFGKSDVWIMKIDENGIIQWQRLLGGSEIDLTESLIETKDGSILVVGSSFSSASGSFGSIINNGTRDAIAIKLDYAGNIIWQTMLGGSADDRFNNIVETEDGDYLISGLSNSTNSGTLTGITTNGLVDAWVLKMSSFGKVKWQRLYGGSSFEGGNPSLVCGFKDGSFVLICGSQSSNSGTLSGIYSNGLSDLWILSLSSNGIPKGL